MKTHSTPSAARCCGGADARLLAAALGVLMLAAAEPALAAAASTTFDNLYDTLKAWAEGTLGKSLAVVMLIVGLAAGCLRGSLTGAVICLGAALALASGPDMIDAIFSASAG